MPSDDHRVEAALQALARTEVRSDVVDAGVRSAMRRARTAAVSDRPGIPWWWMAGSFASGAAVAALLLVVDHSTDRESAETGAPVAAVPVPAKPSVVRWGADVWIHTTDGAVVEAEPSGRDLDFRLERGTLGVRLAAANDPVPKTVTDFAGDVRVKAVGTIFSVSRIGDEVSVHVSEGEVQVQREGGTAQRVEAGQALRSGVVAPTEELPAVHSVLAGVSIPEPAAVSAPEDEPSDDRASDLQEEAEASPRPSRPGSGTRRRGAPSEAQPEASSSDSEELDTVPDDVPVVGEDAEDETIEASMEPEADEGHLEGLWRRARAAVAQGRTRAALPMLQEISDSYDSTWAPLASLELARLYLRSGDLRRAAFVAERFLERFSDHALAPEAEAVRCRAEPTHPSCSPAGTVDR